MTPELDEAGYLQTKARLADLLERRSRVATRGDLSSTHRGEVVRSYDRIIRQYRGEIKLYEATMHPLLRRPGNSPRRSPSQ